MAVSEIGEIYRCNICGNVVRVITVGGGTLVCCGQEMETIEEQKQTPINIPDSGG
jgi:desulfoferrodoxin-like iron-binding protein